MISYEEGMVRLRQTVARDLHDSVAQSLAGALFRVEAACKAIIAGNSPEEELAAIKDALESEQRHVRVMIDRLCTALDLRTPKGLGQDLAELPPEMEGQWHIQTRLFRPEEPIDVGPTRLHDLRQIPREAIANAARHGGATLVQFDLSVESCSLHLDIVDNSVGGRSGSTHPFQPRSITERVAALARTLDASCGPAGTHLYVSAETQRLTIPIFLADHSALMRSGVERLLAGSGREVVAAVATGAAALSAIAEHEPAIAILDVRMPEGTGIELLEAIRTSDDMHPVVLLTADFGDARSSPRSLRGSRGS